MFVNPDNPSIRDPEDLPGLQKDIANVSNDVKADAVTDVQHNKETAAFRAFFLARFDK